MKIQTQLSNGTSWMDRGTDEIDGFLDRVLERESWVAPYMHREPMTTRQQVLDYLATGKKINFDNEWYSVIRDADAIRQRPQPAVTMVTCGCGHSVDRKLVMTTSRGTSCPDCYDAMSE